MSEARGIVYLVGAGPGDPGLITVRGLELLRNADVVVHDRLIALSLLDLARPGAEIVDVGKSPGHHRASQTEINALLVERARAGRAVVRLKGGDPFVFGRGMEEYEACRRAGVVCVIVSGVTSAIAAPAAAGIPVTHRGVGRSLAIVTARTREDEDGSDLDFAALARLDTVVVLMGRTALRRVAGAFIAAGKDAATPVACIQDGTTCRQRTVVADLATIADRADAADLRAPIVTVIGEAARYAGSERQPGGGLSTKRVVVTGSTTSTRRLRRLLADAGATALNCPLINISYPESCEVLDAAIRDMDKYDWIAFPSVHAVHGFWRGLKKRGLDARALHVTRIAAVGPQTARALRRRSVAADLVPDDFTAKGLAEAMRSLVAGHRILLPCGDFSRAELSAALQAHDAVVERVTVYHNRPASPTPETLRSVASGSDAVLFRSPSAVRRSAELGLDWSGSAVACIGPTTASAALQAGLSVAVVAERHCDDGLVAALKGYFTSNGDCP